MALQIYLNGETQNVPDGLTLGGLVAHLDLPAVRIAIELNRVVVRRSNWSQTEISEGDRIEIVHFVGGGSSSMLRPRLN